MLFLLKSYNNQSRTETLLCFDSSTFSVVFKWKGHSLANSNFYCFTLFFLWKRTLLHCLDNPILSISDISWVLSSNLFQAFVFICLLIYVWSMIHLLLSPVFVHHGCTVLWLVLCYQARVGWTLCGQLSLHIFFYPHRLIKYIAFYGVCIDPSSDLKDLLTDHHYDICFVIFFLSKIFVQTENYLPFIMVSFSWNLPFKTSLSTWRIPVLFCHHGKIYCLLC